MKILQRLYSPEIRAQIVTGDDAELGGLIESQIKILHDDQLKEILTIESLMHKSSLESDQKKKILNFEQNNILAGLLKKLVGQLPIDADLTPKNYDPIDPNKSVFCCKQHSKAAAMNDLGNSIKKSSQKTPLKPMNSAIMMNKISESMKEIWVTHVQKHHSKHLVY